MMQAFQNNKHFKIKRSINHARSNLGG